LFAADFESALDIACNVGWLYEKGSFEERRLLIETLFKGINVKKGKIFSYELNTPFAILCEIGKHASGSNEESNPLVRYESLMAGDPGFEPGHADPESAVLPLDESPIPTNYNTALFLRQEPPANLTPPFQHIIVNT
jgi:hypothetical protein